MMKALYFLFACAISLSAAFLLTHATPFNQASLFYIVVTLSCLGMAVINLAIAAEHIIFI